MKVTKVLLKPELKPITSKDREFLERIYEEWGKLVGIVNAYVNFVYPNRLKNENGKVRYDPELLKDTHEFINGSRDKGKDKGKSKDKDKGKKKQKEGVKQAYRINPLYALTDRQAGLAKLAYSNAETALEKRSLPDLRGLMNTIPIRMSKRPLEENLKNKNNNEEGAQFYKSRKEAKFYEREGTILYDNNHNFVFRLGRERSRNGNARFIISAKAISDRTRFNMLKEAIEGSGSISIGDPCMIVKKGNGSKARYFLHISVSKNIDPKTINDSMRSKNIIRIVGVDLGISRLATLFCIEVDKQANTFKLINAKSIEGEQFITAIRKYEEERRSKQSNRMRGKQPMTKKVSRFKYITAEEEKEEEQIIANRKGESKRIDLRRQIIGYICNEIVKFATANNADLIVIERLRGLNSELKRLRILRRMLGMLYNDINRYGVNKLNEYIAQAKQEYAKGKRKKIAGMKIEILEAIRTRARTEARARTRTEAIFAFTSSNSNSGNSGNSKSNSGSSNSSSNSSNSNSNNSSINRLRLAKLVLRYKRMVEERQFLLSVFAYYQFREELKTEALWNQLLVREISPSYTSQKCVRCGSTSKLNRLTQRRFKCQNQKCAWEMNADYNASLNIALRYAEKVMKLKLKTEFGDMDSSDKDTAGSKIEVKKEVEIEVEVESPMQDMQGKGSSTMIDRSAATPLHASINAGSSSEAVAIQPSGGVATTTSSVQGNPMTSGEGRSLLARGQTKGVTGVKRLCTLDEFMHERKGNGG